MIMQGIPDQNVAKYGSSGEYNIKSSSKYAACSCCPYGYHIDLDFVRYCESITQPNENIGINKRRERRRQRQSMEVMLGLVVSPLNMVTWPEQIQETSTENRKKQFCSPSASDMVKEALQDVVSDFENTLRASKKVRNEDNLKPKRIKIPDTNVDSFNMSYFDAYNGNLSTATLHSIREQMALSLERMRDLENKIKIIPKLQIQLTTLKEEKNQLLKQLNKYEQQKADTLKSCGNNKHMITRTSSLPRQKHSHSMVDLLNCKTRDAAVTCRVITRDIGVGHTVSKSRLSDESPRSSPKESKSIAITTNMSMYDIDTLYEQIKTELSRKARLKINEEIKQKRNFKNVSMETEITMYDIEKIHNEMQSGVRLSDMTIGIENVAKISVGTQFSAKENKIQKYDVGVQFGICKKTSDFGIQISEIKPQLTNIAVNVKPEMYDKSLTVDTVEPCKTCKAIKRTIGVGTDFKIQTPVSLSSLMVPRSKSFNMGDDYTKKIKSISTQCNMPASNATTQTVSQTLLNKSCQYECLQNAHTNKSCQCDLKKLATVRSTDTNGLITCNDIGINCLRTKSFDVACSVNQPCNNCENIKDEIAGNAQPSRIPRPSNIALTPPENRRFKRQQTYTKIPAVPAPDPTTMQLSALEGVTTSTSTSQPDSLSTTKAAYENVSSKSSLSELKSNSSISQLHDLETQREISVHHQTSSFQLQSPVRQEQSRTPQIESATSHYQPSIPQHQILLSDATSQDVTYTSQFISQNTSVEENSLLSPSVDKQRQKVQPSKEMRAAMKVLNDYLQKSPNSNAVHQLKNATNIIQQEWFKVSSTATADPLDVEDYLDCFEETSSALLQYIVNMADMSGNTAMHYAVSHGNFDVVSILLDSKVCNINRSNKAGYTSVMLVSLAEMRSPTHANVVRKLFQLADVNIRAKQHGQTALMLAVSHGRLDMVMMLLEAGADINIQDEDGSTALMCAAEHGHIDIVKHFLAQHDCDSTITDVDGSTALKIALEAGHRDIGVLLYAHERMSHGSSPYSSLKYRRSKGSTPASTPPLNSPSRTHSDITN